MDKDALWTLAEQALATSTAHIPIRAEDLIVLLNENWRLERQTQSLLDILQRMQALVAEFVPPAK